MAHEEGRLGASITFSVPQVIVYPPQEEDMNEPCISFAPNDTVPGLPNPRKTRSRSALNALLQLVMSLPNLNEELPLAAKLPHVADFVSMVRKIQSHAVEEVKVISDSVLQLDWWYQQAGLKESGESDDWVADVERVAGILLNDVLANTRFGKRFETNNARLDTNDRTDSGLGLADNEEDIRHHSTRMLTLSLHDHTTEETVSLVSLLNQRLGHAVATFFFGGQMTNTSLKRVASAAKLRQSPMSSPLTTPRFDDDAESHTKTTPPEPKRQMTFTRLPHFFLFSLHRPLVTTPTSSHLSSTPSPTHTYHPVPTELPAEIDLGFYVDQSSPTPPDASQHTFYRLHGLVTQSDGMFLTYTRLQGGSTWFKCMDEVVQDVDLGTRIESKGVVFALYRMQERS
ncbi:hypothetical protein DFS34DRAFT_577609 [Phlyctochytrium arcticum]|nr:hypothetical protein DFS34DRAFT_577609 [Phlyctochytrium arcticum]